MFHISAAGKRSSLILGLRSPIQNKDVTKRVSYMSYSLLVLDEFDPNMNNWLINDLHSLLYYNNNNNKQ